MIPSDPKQIEKLQALAERNIAKGDWGDEVTIPGVPGGDIPMTPKERGAKQTVSKILSKGGKVHRPQRK